MLKRIYPTHDRNRIATLRMAAINANNPTPHVESFLQIKGLDLNQLYAQFKAAYEEKRDVVIDKSIHVREKNEAKAKASMYIRHYIAGFKMAVERGEYPKEELRAIGLNPNNPVVKISASDKSILAWGENVLSGIAHLKKKGYKELNAPADDDVERYVEAYTQAYKVLNVLKNRVSALIVPFNVERDKVNGVFLELAEVIHVENRSLEIGHQRDVMRMWGFDYRLDDGTLALTGQDEMADSGDTPIIDEDAPLPEEDDGLEV